MSEHARHIRLTLAREAGHPEGDPQTGYDIVAFLDSDDRLDIKACREHAPSCNVRLFRRGETVARGRLRYAAGERWILDFPDAAAEIATGFRLGDERFAPGEYVSVFTRDGIAHPYRVDRVAEVALP